MTSHPRTNRRQVHDMSVMDDDVGSIRAAFDGPPRGVVSVWNAHRQVRLAPLAGRLVALTREWGKGQRPRVLVAVTVNFPAVGISTQVDHWN